MSVSVRQLRDRLLDQDACEWCDLLMSYLFPALLIIFVACTYQIGWIFTAERHLTVSDSFKVCEQPLGNRCDTQYEVILPDRKRDVFKPYGFEFESGVLRYGLQLDKSQYSFSYTFDGQKGAWPYLRAFALAWMLSAGGLLAWFLLGGPKHLGRAIRRGEAEDGLYPEPTTEMCRKRRTISRTAKALWFMSFLNAAMVGGVLVYGLGNVPFEAYKGTLKWFGLSLFLSALALSFDYLAGVDALSEVRNLTDGPRRLVRKVITVLVYGMLAVIVFVMGVISTASLLTT